MECRPGRRYTLCDATAYHWLASVSGGVVFVNVQQASWEAALIAFGGGLLSFFSPCVAPLLPGYLGYLSGGALRSVERAGGGQVSTDGVLTLDSTGGERAVARPILTTTLLFVGGFSATFVTLGLLAASFGRLFAAYQPVMETIVGIVMLVMGAFLLGLLPQSWSSFLLREGRLHLRPGPVRHLGMLGPLALGVVFAAGWTPCIGPVLAALLTYVGATANLTWGAVLLTLYSLGFALPLLALGFGWSVSFRVLDWFRRHGYAISLVTGGALILVGLVYVSGQISTFAIWAQRFTPSVLH